MPTDEPRKTIVLDDQLEETVQKDADINERSFSGQVKWILKQHYAAKIREAEAISPRLREAVGADPTPVFEMPGEVRPSANLETLRNKLGSDKSK